MAEPTDTIDTPATTDQPTTTTTTTPRARETTLDGIGSFLLRNARALIVLGILAGGIVSVTLGWYGAAHTNVITEQIPYLISGGLLGLGLIILSGILATSWLQQRSAEDLREAIARAMRGAAAIPAEGMRPGASANGHHVFALPGGRSYHEAGCPLLEGKEAVAELTAADAAGSGLAPCRLCDPV